MTPTVHSPHSVALGRLMQVARYGAAGEPLLAFPPAGCDEWEYENQGAIQEIEGLLTQGVYSVCTLRSLDHEALLNRAIAPAGRSERQRRYDAYVRAELIPFLRSLPGNRSGGFGVVGIGFGAYHAVNTLLKQPDAVKRCYALSGAFDVTDCMDGVFDADFYYNNPLDYARNLTDPAVRGHLQSCRATLILGGGDWSRKNESHRMATVLAGAGVAVEVDDWGNLTEGWPLWRQQLHEHLRRG
jgi:esterase/lipase superfamily enzyme